MTVFGVSSCDENGPEGSAGLLSFSKWHQTADGLGFEYRKCETLPKIPISGFTTIRSSGIGLGDREQGCYGSLSDSKTVLLPFAAMISSGRCPVCLHMIAFSEATAGGAQTPHALPGEIVVLPHSPENGEVVACPFCGTEIASHPLDPDSPIPVRCGQCDTEHVVNQAAAGEWLPCRCGSETLVPSVEFRAVESGKAEASCPSAESGSENAASPSQLQDPDRTLNQDIETRHEQREPTQLPTDDDEDVSNMPAEPVTADVDTDCLITDFDCPETDAEAGETDAESQEPDSGSVIEDVDLPIVAMPEIYAIDVPKVPEVETACDENAEFAANVVVSPEGTESVGSTGSPDHSDVSADVNSGGRKRIANVFASSATLLFLIGLVVTAWTVFPGSQNDVEHASTQIATHGQTTPLTAPPRPVIGRRPGQPQVSGPPTVRASSPNDRKHPPADNTATPPRPKPEEVSTPIVAQTQKSPEPKVPQQKPQPKKTELEDSANLLGEVRRLATELETPQRLGRDELYRFAEAIETLGENQSQLSEDDFVWLATIWEEFGSRAATHELASRCYWQAAAALAIASQRLRVQADQTDRAAQAERRSRELSDKSREAARLAGLRRRDRS
jgi:hypothetical protein